MFYGGKNFSWWRTAEDNSVGAGEMAHDAKALTAKHGHLRCIPGTHVVGENQLLQAVL